MTTDDRHAAEFAEHRAVLVGAAYRILGSVDDAEDVVQEAWLRWAEADLDEVRVPRAYLVTTTTRLALNRARTQQRRREEYVGPWLPEPVATDGPAGDEAVELAESVSMAMLVVLASLSPLERAAFVLREVFALSYAEVAAALDRSEASVRQLTHRARSHVRARAPRQPVDVATHRAATDRFLRAAQGGSMDELLDLLAPDVVLVSDGGGVKSAALRPIVGADKVGRWMNGILSGPEAGRFSVATIELNGEAAIAAYAGGVVDTVGLLQVDGGLVTQIYLLRNPDKLSRVTVGSGPGA